MNRNLRHLPLLLLLLAALAAAQQKPAASSHPPTVHPVAKSAAATPAAPAANPPSEETVNAFLHNMFGFDESVSWKILEIKPSVVPGLSEVDVLITGPQGPQANKFYVASDGEHAITGDILPFGVHPFAAAQQMLQKGLNGPSRGPADAAVTIVEFSDLQCPHCKQTQPTIDKLMTEEKNARLVFQHFPLPMHDWAAKAAAFSDCVGQKNTEMFWKFLQSVYDAQADITAANADEKLKGLADAAGMPGADAAACAVKPETISRVEHSVALGKSVEITGTPTVFINGRKVPNVGGMPYDVFKNLVEFAAKDK